MAKEVQAKSARKGDAKKAAKDAKPGETKKKRTIQKIDTSDKRAICEQFMPYVRSIAGKIKKIFRKVKVDGHTQEVLEALQN